MRSAQKPYMTPVPHSPPRFRRATRHAQPERDPLHLPRLLRGRRPRDGRRRRRWCRRTIRPCCSSTPAWCRSRTTSPAPRPRRAPRATSSQKCVRAGGKHNDLDNVGYTARHHTFFEMLGNFSFGDYFKERAIEHAWDLLTKEFGLDRREAAGHRLSHRRRGLRPLEEDRRPAGRARSSASPTTDNFWSMGDTGPCGPCTEIFYDHGDHIPGGPPGSAGRGRRPLRRDLEPGLHAVRAVRRRLARDLPKPSIDTGMGLERIAAVLQGVHDNYDIDLFRTPDRAPRKTLTGDAGRGRPTAPSHRVIADHLRSTSFLIADGVTPSNEGRGYVLRRIMRRAMRHAHLLGADEPLMHRLVPTLVERDGRGLSRAAPRRGLHRRHPAPGGGALPPHARPRHEPARRGDRRLPGGRHAVRRDRLQALRHLRLPARPDPGRGARQAASPSTSTASTPPWTSSASRAREHWTGSGQTAAAGEWFALRDRLGADRVHRLRRRPRRRRELLALVEDGARGRRRRGRRDRSRSLFDQHPLLRRERRPGRRQGRGRLGRRRRPGARHPEAGRRPASSTRSRSLQGAPDGRRRGAADGRRRGRARPPAPTTRPPTCCTRR